MKNARSSPLSHLAVALALTVAYAVGAAWFYYAPARGEPNLDVTFRGLFIHFLFLSFLFWIVAIPEKKPFPALNLLVLTLLMVPAGVVASLLCLFALSGAGLRETYGIEYVVLALVPFAVAHKLVKGRVLAVPFILAVLYGVTAYLWVNVPW